MLRTDGEVALRSRKAAIVFNLILAACFAIAGVWIAFGIPGYFISMASLTPSTWLAAVLSSISWRLVGNYRHYPATILLPGIAFAGIAIGLFVALKNKGGIVCRQQPDVRV